MFAGRMWESMAGHVFSRVAVRDSLVTKIRDLKFWQYLEKKRVKHFKTYKHTQWRAHTRTYTRFNVSLAVNIFPLPPWIAGKVFLPESPHPSPAERVALRCCLPQRQRKLSLLSSHCSGGVNLSEIFWESGGNLLCAGMFIGRFIPQDDTLIPSPRTPLQHHPDPRLTKMRWR